MATTINAIPFDIAAKEIGKDKLRTLISRGIVTYVRKPTFFSGVYTIRFSTSKVSSGIFNKSSSSISIVFVYMKFIPHVRMNVLMT